jgi:uncharacterized membrane protein YkoI
MRKKTLMVIAATGLVALGGGTAVALADEDARERITRTVTRDEPVRTDLTVEQAIAKAQEAVKGSVESVELEDGGSKWELDLLAENGSWREVTVHADGRVTHKAKDDSDDSKEDLAQDRAEALKAARVSASQAAATAVGPVPGTVTSVELENDVRGPFWKVEIRDGEGVEHEVFVDAAEDRVLSSRVSDDDSDDGDDD